MLPARDYLGDEVWKEWKRDYDELMAYRKTIKGKPDIYQQAMLALNQPWIDFYKSALFHTAGKTDCNCRNCSLLREEVKKHQGIPDDLLEKMRMRVWIN